MRLRELFEAEEKHIAFCFGRMNPPTIGHEQLLDTCKSVGGDYRIFVSQTQDKKKNPLDYATKIKFIKEMFPEYAGDVVDNAGLNTIGKVASYLHEQGYNSATFVAGSDRLEDMKNLLTQYNGVEGKAHGFYDFEVLDFVSSGEREDGAEGVEVSVLAVLELLLPTTTLTGSKKPQVPVNCLNLCLVRFAKV